uniref:uncharacterized protein LOC124075182 isoform X3 n=1 Tax=Scatophagus argus TaxID=75038 RepID=UPI001ED812AF|nr:uncharacterized protein LOC124075182 isoform X3 [Scatophagus argus]
MTPFLFLLFVITGCCVGQDLLPDGPVEAVLRKNVTFETLVDFKDDFITFTWYFSRGSELKPIVTVTPTGETVSEGYQGRVQVNRTNGFLTLGPLKANDRGYYKATMVTSKKRLTGETMLRILGCCKWYALPEGPVDAVLGKNVTFKTLIDPKEEINATVWFYSSGGKLIRVADYSRVEESVAFVPHQGRVTVNQTNGFMTMGPLVMADSGDYHVNIFTPKGVMIGETKLRVLEPVSDVNIRANVSEMVEFNSTVVLTCSARGSFLKFSWTSGTTPIMADNTRVTIEEEATSSVLTISGIRSSDLTGSIYCTAANQLEMEKSAPFNLTVLFPPPPPVLTPTKPGSSRWSVTFLNPDPCAVKGSSVQFRCSYDYPDGETVQKNGWFKGEFKDNRWKRIQLLSLPSYQNRVKYVGDQEHNCSLEIYNLQDNDTGYYYFRFDTHTYGWHSRRSVYLSLTDLIASVKPSSVRQGQNVTLTCDTSCNLPEEASIVWFRNGQPVVKAAQFQASAEDAGNYTCAVEGQESVQSDPVVLDVQSPTGLPEEEESGELRTTSSHAATSPHTTMSPQTTVSLYTTLCSHANTAQEGRDTRLVNQDYMDIQHAWFDKLHAELEEMRLSFDRSLRQMESRTHSLLWSLSRRLEQLTETIDRNSASPHQTKTYLSISHLLSKGASTETHLSQHPVSHPVNLQIRGQRKREGQRGSRT